MTSPSRKTSLLGGDDSTRVSNQPMIPERRIKFRYPLDLIVHFRSPAGAPIFSGAGRSANLSSGGVFVVCRHLGSQDEIDVGARVELNFEWPSQLDGMVALQLCAVGRIIRRGPFGFAARFVRHEFRTMRG
jgi:hypothetical protein